MTPAPVFHFTPEHKAQFERDGYLVIPNFFTKETADALKHEADVLLHDFELAGHPRTVFISGDGKKKKLTADEYFLSSGDKIRFFFEEKAFDKDGNLIKPKEMAINKIGHALHALNPVFRKFSTSESVKSIARGLGKTDPRVLQSMVITKQPRIGGEVLPHQDSTFLYTTPVSAIGLWFALEDCTKRNGALSFLPGSHKTTPIKERFVRLPEGGTAMEPLKGAGFEIEEKDGVVPGENWKLAEMEKGSAVIIHGGVLHQSEDNKSEKSRYAYTFHIIDGEAEYDEKNWLQPSPDVPFMPLYDQ